MGKCTFYLLMNDCNSQESTREINMLFDASTLEIEADLPRDGDKMSP